MRRRAFTLFSAATVGVLTALPFMASADEAADRAAIEGIWETYSAAVVDGDSGTWLGLWDDGGIQMPPGAPARGKDVLDQASPSEFAPGSVSSMNIRPEEITIAEDWAYTRGTYDLTDVTGDSPVMIDGKFMTILKRQDDGSWKIYRDIFNSNTP